MAGDMLHACTPVAETETVKLALVGQIVTAGKLSYALKLMWLFVSWCISVNLETCK